MRGEDPDFIKSGHHRSTSETPFAGESMIGPTLNAGLVAFRLFRVQCIRTSIASCKKPFSFVIFQGGVDTDPGRSQNWK